MNIGQANNISIVDFLSTLNITPVRQNEHVAWYKSPIRTPEKTASFKVDKKINKWYDHGIGLGGGTLDLALLLFQTTDISDTLARLSSPNIVHDSPQTSVAGKGSEVVSNEVTKIKVAGVKPLSDKPTLISYLNNRRIPLNIAESYCNSVDFTLNGKAQYAVGFQNRAGGFELRNAYFKGSTSPKDITHIYRGNSAVTIFEGFIDFLSGLAVPKLIPILGDVIILNSTNLLAKNLDTICQYTHVTSYLDNDVGGKRAFEVLKNNCSHVNNASEVFKGYNDVNDWLCARNTGTRPQVRRLKK